MIKYKIQKELKVMEIDTTKTLCDYADKIEVNLRERFRVMDDCLTIKDIKSPFTLVGVNHETNTFLIMRGYKKRSLVKRYLSHKYGSRIFFIVDIKLLELLKYELGVTDVSTYYYI